MVLGKLLLASGLILGIVGFGLFSLVDAGSDVADIFDHGWGGGGCHDSDSYGNYERGWEGSCHDWGEDEEETYCPYHDEYLDNEEWEEHRDDCPNYEE